jgi:hypothetical protein
MVVKIQQTKKENEMFTIKRNASGPGWHILNEKGREVCWIFEQGYGHKVQDKERAQMFCDLLNAPPRTVSFGAGDGFRGGRGMNAHDPARLLARLHQTAHARMIADVPSVKTRMEFMHAWRESGKWLRDNANIDRTDEGGSVK